MNVTMFIIGFVFTVVGIIIIFDAKTNEKWSKFLGIIVIGAGLKIEDIGYA